MAKFKIKNYYRQAFLIINYHQGQTIMNQHGKIGNSDGTSAEARSHGQA
jgi:hypothetical protein